MAINTRNKKVKGRVLEVIDGLIVSVDVKRAKSHGKDRIWFQIRQQDPKKWRVAESLAYARGVDVQFEDDSN
jgi:hypothetical protein